MDVGAGCRDSAEHARFVSLGRARKNRADDHFALVGILPFTDSVNFSTLADETAHRWILMPDVTQLYFGDLSERIVRRAVLGKWQNCELTNQFTPHGGPHDVERKLSCGGWRANDADPFGSSEYFVEFGGLAHKSGSALSPITVHAMQQRAPA